MLTENGAIRVKSPYDKKMYLRLNLKNIISSSVFFTFGFAGLIASIVFGAVSGEWDGFLIGGCSIIVALSLFLLTVVLVSVNKGIKLNKYAQSDMYLEFMHVTEFENGEKVSQSKVDYSAIYKRVETKDYFLAYMSRVAVHPICKTELTKEEINTIRRLLNIAQNDDGEVPVASGKGVNLFYDDETFREIIISPDKNKREDNKEDGSN